MTLPFLKLHVAGHDFILIDQDKLEVDKTTHQPAPGVMAELMLDRRCGIGADGCIFMASAKDSSGSERTLTGRLFGIDGREVSLSPDALLCIARLALDTGRSSANILTIHGPLTGYSFELKAINSRSFMLTLPYPQVQPLTLIVDGKTAWAYRVRLRNTYTVAFAIPQGPGAKRVRQALLAMGEKNEIPLVLRMYNKDTIRFVGPDRIDRVEGAIAAVLSAGFQGFVSESLQTGTEGAIIAEWRGRGGAVSYASFPPLATSEQASSPAVLIDRGRFWVNPNLDGTIQVIGKAEYIFDGNFDI